MAERAAIRKTYRKGGLRRIEVAREVHEAAQRLDLLDGLQGHDGVHCAEFAAEYFRRQLEELRSAEMPDAEAIAAREWQVAFWQDVIDYMQAIELESTQGYTEILIRG